MSFCWARSSQQLFGGIAAADDHGAPVEASLECQPAHEDRERAALDQEHGEAEQVPAEEPDTRENAFELQKKTRRERRQKHQGPAADETQPLLHRRTEGVDLVDVERLEDDDRERRDEGDGGIIDRGRSRQARHRRNG